MAQPISADDAKPILPSAKEAGFLALVRNALTGSAAARLLGPEILVETARNIVRVEC
jgi:hypothetical protein